jgi:tetratricopeptide (TPR) repeat protein
MLARAVSLGVAGDLTAARRELAAYRSAVSQTPPTIMFEYDEWRGGAWERAAVEIMHRDRALARTLLVDSGLMSHARYAELLRRAIYQQYVDSGQTAWRRAIPGLEEVIALVPGDAEAWYYLGYCHYRLGSDLEARRAFERALDLDPALEARYPKQGGPAMLLAKLAGRGGDRNAARRWLARAVELHGNLDIAAHDPRLAALVPEASTSLR